MQKEPSYQNHRRIKELLVTFPNPESGDLPVPTSLLRCEQRGQRLRQAGKSEQATLFEMPEEVKEEEVLPSTGKTVIDRLYQAMLLFADGRSSALRRFIVDEGLDSDDRFWRLVQSLSALYPPHTDEKRWVDGVLVRKRVLNFSGGKE